LKAVESFGLTGHPEFDGSFFSTELILPFESKALQKAAFHPIANNRR
jgi:hypothetical protein